MQLSPKEFFSSSVFLLRKNSQLEPAIVRNPPERPNFYVNPHLITWGPASTTNPPIKSTHRHTGCSKDKTSNSWKVSFYFSLVSLGGSLALAVSLSLSLYLSS